MRLAFSVAINVDAENEVIMLMKDFKDKLSLVPAKPGCYQMKDKDGKPCDTLKSYVEMTKYTEEYRLKVNLSCGDYEDYIIVYLGCYDYCDGLCEKRVESTAVKPAVGGVTPAPTAKYMYEYKLVIPDKTTCTDWTKWGKDIVQLKTNTAKPSKKRYSLHFLHYIYNLIDYH